MINIYSDSKFWTRSVERFHARTGILQNFNNQVSDFVALRSNLYSIKPGRKRRLQMRCNVQSTRLHCFRDSSFFARWPRFSTRSLRDNATIALQCWLVKECTSETRNNKKINYIDFLVYRLKVNYIRISFVTV
jgi:hypothetical protein